MLQRLLAHAFRGPSDELIPSLLSAMRQHLQMDFAFVSQFVDGERVFRFVDSGCLSIPFQAGDSGLLQDSFCQRVIDGRLPEMIRNAGEHVEARSLEVTLSLPIGAHLSVPVRLPGGEIYGTLCAFSREADDSLNERDIRLLRLLADVIGIRLGSEVERDREVDRRRSRVAGMLNGDGLRLVYQPICDSRTQTLVGMECLSRFQGDPLISTQQWFTDAHAVGLGAELELRAIELALAECVQLPGTFYLSVNVSPDTLNAERDLRIGDFPPQRLVVEITENQVIEEYELLKFRLRRLRNLGVRIAIDDAGAGYASFRHILGLEPDFIKLDRSLTHEIDRDVARRALTAALIRFADETGSEIIAEGVERVEELNTLRDLGVHKVQGYFVGRPEPMQRAVQRHCA